MESTSKPKDTYYQRNREEVLARRKARFLANPEHYREKARLQMARWRATNPRVSQATGLTFEAHERQLAAQGGKCAICGTTKGKWHGDHDHDTGRFRGILCQKCNMGLGMFDDEAGRLAAAIAYLEKGGVAVIPETQ